MKENILPAILELLKGRILGLTFQKSPKQLNADLIISDSCEESSLYSHSDS